MPSPFRRDAAIYLVFALLAAATAILTAGESFRSWGELAAAGYLLGAVAALLLGRYAARERLRIRLLAGVVIAVLVVPLLVQISFGIEVSEVGIAREAGARLLETGSPYPTAEELDRLSGPLAYQAYNVYLPALALFGLPAAFFGETPFTDPRLFFVAAGVGALLASGRGARPILWVLCVAPVALTVVSGANDLPVLGLICLGLVLTHRGKALGAGVATGFAAAMKVHAWPAFPVCLIYVAARHGRRAALKSLAAFAATMAVLVGVPAAMDFEAFVINVVRLPLGLEEARLLANTPLPGQVLAASGPIGRTITVTLLVVAVLAVLAWLIARPPHDLVATAGRLAILFVVGILLAPQARLGYFIYPTIPLLWLAPDTLLRLRVLWRRHVTSRAPMVRT